MEVNSISFGGQYVTSANILKKNLKGKFNSCKGSIVEIDTLNNRDIKALLEVSDKWQQEYSREIYDNARFINEMKYRSLLSRFFVLTTQKSNFAKLNPDEILAELQFSVSSKLNKINLEYFQVDPKSNFWGIDRLYKKVGTGFIDAMKFLYKDSDITLSPAPSAIKFYLKNGFKFIEDSSYMMKFSKKG